MRIALGFTSGDGGVQRDYRRSGFCPIASELSNAFNLRGFYAISEALREGFEGFRTKGTF